MVKKAKEPSPKRYTQLVNRALFRDKNLPAMTNFCVSQILQGFSEVVSVSRIYPYCYSHYQQRSSTAQMFSVTVVKIPGNYTQGECLNAISHYLSSGKRHSGSSYHIGIGMDINIGSDIQVVKDEFGNEERLLVLWGETYAQPLAALIFSEMFNEDSKDEEEAEELKRAQEKEYFREYKIEIHNTSGISSLGSSTSLSDYFPATSPSLRDILLRDSQRRSNYNFQDMMGIPETPSTPIPGTNRDRRAARTGRNVPVQGQNQASQSRTLRGLLRNI